MCNTSSSLKAVQSQLCLFCVACNIDLTSVITVIHRVGTPWLHYQADLVDVTGSKTDVMGFHKQILHILHPSDLQSLAAGNPTPDLLLKVVFATVFAYETKRTEVLGDGE